MFSIYAELRDLVTKLAQAEIPYALCGALALAIYGHPRATLDIDLLALDGSSEKIRQCAREGGFTLNAAPMEFANGAVRIERLSKVIASEEDVLMLDVLSLSPEIERKIVVKTVVWQGVELRTVSQASLVRLKKLRGNAQDMADIDKLR